jgi:tetratricopeptide (TPR) repeat protein
MRSAMCRLAVPAICSLLLLAGAAAARADQTDQRLDGLFAELKETQDATVGVRLTEQIWEIWLEPKGEKARDLLAKGVAAMHDDQFDVALDEFNRLVEAAPDFAEGWNRRATLLYLMGEYDGSVRDIERTLQLEPRHFGALSGLGLVYLQLGDDQSALKAFKQALEINPHLRGARDNADDIEKRLNDRGI